MKKNDSHTCQLDQHTYQLKTLERQVRMLITAINDNNIRGHSACVATNNNDDTRLDKLEEVLRQHIKSAIQTNNRTNKKIKSLTSTSADNEDNNNDNTTRTTSIDRYQQ